MKARQVITVDQLRQRDEWDLRLMRGECTLSDALSMCMHIGAPASPYLIARFEGAIAEYQDGHVSDLAEPFGIAISKTEKNAQNKKTRVSNVKFHVDSFYEKGFSKQDPSYYDNTAFHKAAELLGKKPSNIFDLYYEK